MAPTAATRDAEAQVFETGSGLEIQELYGPDDVPALDPERDLGNPANTRSCAAPTPACTARASGRGASRSASARPRRPTSASATCTRTGRTGS